MVNSVKNLLTIKKGFEPWKSEAPNRQQTECPLTNRLNYWGSSKRLNSIALPYDERAFSPPNFTAGWHTCLLFISMLWHWQTIFESKRNKRSSSAECRIRTQGLWNRISRLNARWQTDWAIEDQAKNLTSIARPYEQRALSPLDPTASWLSHLAVAIYMFVVARARMLCCIINNTDATYMADPSTSTIYELCFKFPHLESQPHLPGDNQLISMACEFTTWAPLPFYSNRRFESVPRRALVVGGGRSWAS